jgi:hypothetical protein
VYGIDSNLVAGVVPDGYTSVRARGEVGQVRDNVFLVEQEIGIATEVILFGPAGEVSIPVPPMEPAVPAPTGPAAYRASKGSGSVWDTGWTMAETGDRAASGEPETRARAILVSGAAAVGGGSGCRIDPETLTKVQTTPAGRHLFVARGPDGARAVVVADKLSTGGACARGLPESASVFDPSPGQAWAAGLVADGYTRVEGGGRSTAVADGVFLLEVDGPLKSVTASGPGVDDLVLTPAGPIPGGSPQTDSPARSGGGAGTGP